MNYIEGNQNVQKKNARNKRKFFEAAKNFMNPSNPKQIKKRKYLL
jgi:hypothetical protein